MKVEIKEKGIIDEEKQIYRTEPYLKNMFVGNVRMMDHIYELEDINVQYGACDVEIDLTTAMIPEGETVIVIRGVVGNIRLYVPYDIELSLNHSVIVGVCSCQVMKRQGLTAMLHLEQSSIKRLLVVLKLFLRLS